MKTLIVTGHSGFFGSALCKRLEQKYKVVKISKGSGDLAWDISNSFSGKLPDAYAIIHLAAIIKTNNKEDYYKVNSNGTLNLLNAAKISGIKRIIFASTMNVYGRNNLNITERMKPKPLTEYGKSKLLGEKYCEKFAKKNTKSIVLRFQGIYGPKRKSGAIYNFLNNLIMDLPIKLNTTSADSWDPAYIDDAVNAIMLALNYFKKMKNNFEIFNISGGELISLQALIQLISQIVHKKPKFTEGHSKQVLTFSYNLAKAHRLLNFKPNSLFKNLKKMYGVIKNEQ